jgi:hypothetical protein
MRNLATERFVVITDCEFVGCMSISLGLSGKGLIRNPTISVNFEHDKELIARPACLKNVRRQVVVEKPYVNCGEYPRPVMAYAVGQF